MVQANVITFASVCLTVHSANSPGEGCCFPEQGFSFHQSYPLQLDEIYDQITEMVDPSSCDLEMAGIEAISADGQKMLQDMSATCIDRADYDTKITKFRSVNLNLPDGGVDATIIYHANGTVEANCDTALGRRLQANDNCFGPKYHDSQPFLGNVSYGSLRTERFGNTLSGLRTYIDLDVDNDCLPIRMTPFTITDFDAAAPSDSLFVIPPECSQQSVKASRPVTHPKSALGAMRSSVVV